MTPGIPARPRTWRSLTLLPWLGLCLLLLGLTGCESVPTRPPLHYTGDPLIDGRAELQAAQPKDRVLWQYRLAASALRRNQVDEARLQLDTALPLAGGIITNSQAAQKARSLFGNEDSKTFIGEPYERIMAFYYRAVLYWQEGQPDNARACYRTGQLIDSDAEANQYKSDFVLLDYLDGFASAKLGADGSDSLARARANSRIPLPDYNTDANVLIFAEYGVGPRKIAGGEYGEQLRFVLRDSLARSARLSIAGKSIELPAYDDLNFQASTRGGRLMDYILGKKAVFKENTDTLGDLSLTGAAIAANNMYRRDGTKRHDTENAAIALGAIGLLSKLASAATTPRADTRCWQNLPQRLSFATLSLPAGDYQARLDFFDQYKKRLSAHSRTFTLSVKPEGDTVLFLSELSR